MRRNSFLRLPLLALPLAATAARAQSPPEERQHPAPYSPTIHDVAREPYRVLRAGEGFRGSVFGSEFEAAPRDRRSVAAWDVGVASAPRAEDAAALPFASAYLWQRPDDTHFLRAIVAGVYNDITIAGKPAGSNTEVLFTFESYAWPAASAPLIDGEIDETRELTWGYARPGVGIGLRDPIGPAQDNLLVCNLVGEVGALWFGRGDQTDPGLGVPDSTTELRLRTQLRYDLLQRNLLEMPHEGHALGADFVYGHRSEWDDWGPAPLAGAANSTRNYAIATAYGFMASGVPFVDSEFHRLIASIHAGVGDDTDRFSAPRLGGGPDPRGEEFGLVARPILPGAALGEFYPSHYAVLHAGYRLQPMWFAFVDVGATAAWLDRDRLTGLGTVRNDDWMTAVNARLSSGCFGRTRFQLLYAYNFDVVRNGEDGGHELAFHVTGFF